MTPNTRKEARHRRRLRVLFEGRPAFTTNVNLSGFCAELMRAVSPATTVEGTITIEGRDFEYVGDVRWVKPGEGMGVQFKALGVRETHALASYLDVALKEPKSAG